MFTGKFVKKHNKLEFKSKKDKTNWDAFNAQLKENAVVDIFLEIIENNGSLAQLAKIHKMIRELSIKTGQPFNDIKDIVKIKSGLYISREIEGKEFLIFKSFGECSRDELAIAIQWLVENESEYI